MDRSGAAPAAADSAQYESEDRPPEPARLEPIRFDAGSAGALADFGVNAAAVEEIQARWAGDPGSVDPAWAAVFDAEESAAGARLDRRTAEKHARVLRLIHAYRARGHRIAEIDPLGGRRDSYFPELDPGHYGLGHDDLDRPFLAGDLPGGPVQPLRDILALLRETYCGKVGVEFTHIQDPGRKVWVQRRLEESRNRSLFGKDDRLRILERLAEAELFERFLHTKFLGQKRFSLEGAETLIALLDAVVEAAPGHGVRELTLGMAHRGRLNVLSNVLGKSLESIFGEFEDIENVAAPFGSGDVKYHKGFSNTRRTRSGQRVHLSLTGNPSHLEAVNPVVEGRARAKQASIGDRRGRTIVPLLIHGDAAFAGQGVVAETLNLSRLAGYSTGGTIHVVVNNQIGFTATPAETRSTLYCTDVAKMLQAPVFHVNGDDPEAVVHVALFALEYRQRFGEDVVIDLVCYRRHGHNEGDEPSFTQPLLYEKIRSTQPVRHLYQESLLAAGVITREDAERMEKQENEQLLHALETIKTRPPGPDEPYEPGGPWTGFSRRAPREPLETGVAIERLQQIGERLAEVPPGFELHRKLVPFLEKRRKAIAEGAELDWAFAEALAFGSLLLEGYAVRLSGQDSSRGTFSHRHAVLVDQSSEAEYAPLAHLANGQGRFEVYDSLLSEAAVLGFEYGYASTDPMTLVLWEAQFGDFANGAQVIIDQFVASAGVKWGRINGLVLLLPHGYEGQGPEHSSGRIERYLQLCAEDNLQVVNCTTPAQYFHVLRRQMRRNYRAPLVVFTPKSLLRAPRATSKPAALADGRFQTVLADPLARPEQVRRVLLCSGKIYYELLEERDKRFGEGQPGDVAILRLEQLYPFDAEALAGALAPLAASAEHFTWVQEEPRNMGAWSFVQERIEPLLPAGRALGYAGRLAYAAPAGGSMRVHRRRQSALIAQAFGDDVSPAP
ncbi:MAG: 2-oxoglutarate dehydrogenase E1 component [Deltaproteobacteria bacterium]|nr:2-oxoglutarate dehydrogenase E1 component [Deltaproteobacteria bacterium]